MQHPTLPVDCIRRNGGISLGYNLPVSTGFNSGFVLGSTAPDIAQGQANEALKQAANDILPQGYTLAWRGISCQEHKVGEQSILVFAFGIANSGQTDRKLFPWAMKS
ncbi:hypothetical protein [Nitrosomonas halophila]|uniref:hypothetical protein n=1 Tax=Nitrosomonas halophila TaxID=44576 RepID=UPI00115F7C61|nr:hypothetical protein [Nitrosomonas halophila]